MTAEQKFIWWLKGFLDANPDAEGVEPVRKELEKVIQDTATLTVSTPYNHSKPTTRSLEPLSFEPLPYPPQPTVIKFSDTTPWTPVVTCTADIDKRS